MTDQGRRIVFKAFDEKAKDIRAASAEENEQLEKKLFEITQSIIYSELSTTPGLT